MAGVWRIDGHVRCVAALLAVFAVADCASTNAGPAAAPLTESREHQAAKLLRVGARDRAPIALDEAPCRGPDRALVTITVFSDFECPACAVGRELLGIVERESKTPLRICYKHFPLPQHLHARLAARAAIAAQRQGRFWAYHDRLFDDQSNLTKADLMQRAKDLGLDMKRFASDLAGEKGRAIVQSDLEEGLRLRVQATPTFFVNGRQMTGSYLPETFNDWIEEEVAVRRGAQGGGKR